MSMSRMFTLSLKELYIGRNGVDAHTDTDTQTHRQRQTCVRSAPYLRSSLAMGRCSLTAAS